MLDEPTNDLDLETLDLLQALIDEYSGTVFIVSHDRDFLDRVCTSVMIAEGDGHWTEYAGGYSDMLSQRGYGLTPLGGDAAPNRKAAAKTAAPARVVKRKMANKDRYALKLLPGEIEALDKAISKLETELADPDIFKDTARFTKASKELAAALASRSEKEDRWLELETERVEIEGE